MCQTTAPRPKKARRPQPAERQRLELEFNAGLLYMAFEAINADAPYQDLPVPAAFLSCRTDGEMLRHLADLSDRIHAAD